MLKKTTNKKTIAIVVLAVLLVALLAFNITYAYFTDQVTSNASVNFGKVDINVGTAIEMSADQPVMPGDIVTLDGIFTNDSTEAVWVKFSVDNIKVYYGSAESEDNLIGSLAGGVTAPGTKVGDSEAPLKNMFYDGNAVDGTGYEYTSTDVETMLTLAQETLSEAFAAFVNQAAGAGAWAVWSAADSSAEGYSAAYIGITKAPVAVEAELDFADATTGMTLSKTDFGNLWQNVVITFDVVVQAVQSTGVDTVGAAAVLFTDTGFNSGLID